MLFIKIENLSVYYDVYDLISRSLKGKIISGIKNIPSLTKKTGGEISSSHEGILVNALKNINLTINEGDRIGIVGHNGCGKSTLLKVLSGIIYPDKGSVEINGKIASILDPTVGVDYEMSGIENIYIRGITLGLDKKFIDTNLERIIDFSELGEYVHLPLKTYSNGMKARLIFSISTVLSPEIYLVDEALEAGDENFQSKIRKSFDEKLSKIKILLIASHNKDFIRQNCNKILELEKGKIKKFDKIF